MFIMFNITFPFQLQNYKQRTTKYNTDKKQNLT